ncbi:MAG TPA: fasciclin domain-containing protein [Actinomycetota bacterium]
MEDGTTTLHGPGCIQEAMRMAGNARGPSAGLPRRAWAIAALLTLLSCGGAEEATPREPSPTAAAASPTESPAITVADVLSTDERFTTLSQALVKDPLYLEVMSRTGWNHTVFAPTDEAFGQLPAGRLASLLEDEERIPQLLDNHIVPELVPTDEMEDGDLQTIRGVHEVDVGGDPIMIDGARIVEADLVTSNGIIHVIDGVFTVLCLQIGSGDPQCSDLLEG